MRLALAIAKRHKRSRKFGWSVLSYQSHNELGLIGLGTVVAPRPFSPWRRDTPNASGIAGSAAFDACSAEHVAREVRAADREFFLVSGH
jgi:hypothetical protein